MASPRSIRPGDGGFLHRELSARRNVLAGEDDMATTAKQMGVCHRLPLWPATTRRAGWPVSVVGDGSDAPGTKGLPASVPYSHPIRPPTMRGWRSPTVPPRL